MIIRKANINDIDGILMIVNDAVDLLKSNNVNQWQNGYPNREVFLNDIKKGTLYVTCDENVIAGVCNLCFNKDPSYEKVYFGKWITNDDYLVIHRIAVKKEYYHKRVAKMMFSFSEELALYNNVKSIKIDTHKDNIPMNKILKNIGYQECGIIYLLNYADQDKERVAFEKVLKG
jgi:ribosomal protein S18 acetylase RimI-like enzyme